MNHRKTQQKLMRFDFRYGEPIKSSGWSLCIHHKTGQLVWPIRALVSIFFVCKYLLCMHILFHFMSCHVTSCHVTSCHVISFHFHCNFRCYFHFDFITPCGEQAEATQQPKIETYASSFSSVRKTKAYEIIDHVNPYIARRQIQPTSN